MDAFTRLFGYLLVFVYHCFDRIVINGYMKGVRHKNDTGGSQAARADSQ